MIAGGLDIYSLLEWAMAMLVKYPDVMTKLKDELKEVAGSKSFISEDDLSKLQYLKAVIKETFRFCAPGAFVPRVSTKDVKVMGFDIAAGTQVLVNKWALGRDPTLWEKPEEFRPERFLNSSIDLKGQHFELLPFGSGRRVCPGTTFSLVIVELAVANLACNFNFALPGGERAEDLDITEAPGVMSRRRTPLLLVPSLC